MDSLIINCDKYCLVKIISPQNISESFFINNTYILNFLDSRLKSGKYFVLIFEDDRLEYVYNINYISLVDLCRKVYMTQYLEILLYNNQDNFEKYEDLPYMLCLYRKYNNILGYRLKKHINNSLQKFLNKYINKYKYLDINEAFLLYLVLKEVKYLKILDVDDRIIKYLSTRFPIEIGYEYINIKFLNWFLSNKYLVYYFLLCFNESNSYFIRLKNLLLHYIKVSDDILNRYPNYYALFLFLNMNIDNFEKLLILYKKYINNNDILKLICYTLNLYNLLDIKVSENSHFVINCNYLSKNYKVVCDLDNNLVTINNILSFTYIPSVVETSTHQTVENFREFSIFLLLLLFLLLFVTSLRYIFLIF